MLITTTDVYQCHFNFAHGQPTCKALYKGSQVDAEKYTPTIVSHSGKECKLHSHHSCYPNIVGSLDNYGTISEPSTPCTTVLLHCCKQAVWNQWNGIVNDGILEWSFILKI